jgi:glycosyltransferase 2 family protein
MFKFKKVFSVLLRVIISVVLLVLLFKLNKIDIRVLADDIKGADKLFLTIGFLVCSCTYLLGFLRWQMLLKAVGINIPLSKLISSFSGGIFFNVFLPSTIGGDLVRTADLAAHTNKAKQVIATVFLDRLSGYIGLVILVLFGILLGRGLIHDKVVFSSIAGIVILLISILLVLFNNSIYTRITKFLSLPGAGRIKEMVKDTHREIHAFRNRKKMISYNLILSFFIQILSALSVYFISLSLGVKVSIIYFVIALPIIGAITLLPIAIGGLGLREGLYVVYFAKAGVIKQLALAMSLLSFSFTVIFGAMGGVIYVLTVHHRRLQHNKPSSI